MSILGDSLLVAIAEGNLNEIKHYLDRGANINYIGPTGVTPLIEAINKYYNNPAIVKLLLDRGADPNLEDHGLPPLIIAIYKGNLKIVKLLLDHGADPNAKQPFGILPALALAVQLNELGIFKELLERGANPNQGGKALIQAVSGNHIEIVKELLNHGANVNQQNILGDTALMVAADSGYPNIVRLLLDHGANPDLTDRNGKTAFDYAQEIPTLLKKEEIIQLLTKFKQTPLDPALTNPEDGVTNLMILVSNPDKFPLLEEFFNRPEDIRPIVNQQDDQGNTALLYAVANNPHPETIRFLLENGADPLIKNNQGYSALDYAQDLGERNILRLFQRYL